MHATHHNWIDGLARPADSGDTFEVRIEGSRAAIGRWPRSGAADLDHALDAAGRAHRTWCALDASARREMLAHAVDALLDEPDPGALAQRTLGLSADEIEEHVEPLEWALDDVLAGRAASFAGQRDGAREGSPVWMCEWSEMWRVPACAVLGALLAGRSLIVLSDPHAPMLADSLARAFSLLPPGAFAVLHDDGRTLARAAVADARAGSIHAPSTSAAVPELDERASKRAYAPLAAGFGAGVEHAVGPDLCVRHPSNQSFVVRPELDLEEQAHELVARAFSRGWALSGARPGRAGRALCPLRVFSRFSELVLDALETAPDAQRPLGIVRATLESEIQRASRLGHDEGATAIFTGPESAEHGFPLVFTNVEERMRLAHLARPAPVLCLMRAHDAAHARALAERLEATRIDV